MTRALVLGGGGPLGVGWAGSIVGAQLTAERALADLPSQFGRTAPWAIAAGDTWLDLGELLATRDPADATPEDEWVAHFDSFGGDRVRAVWSSR